MLIIAAENIQIDRALGAGGGAKDGLIVDHADDARVKSLTVLTGPGADGFPLGLDFSGNEFFDDAAHFLADIRAGRIGGGEIELFAEKIPVTLPKLGFGERFSGAIRKFKKNLPFMDAEEAGFDD